MTVASAPDPDLLVIEAEQAWVDGVLRPARVHVRAGRIEAVHDGGAPLPPSARQHRLAPGHVLLPGFVDSHVHVNEPGRTEWEGFASATRAALLAGVTTIVDMPLNSVPVTTSPQALAAKRAAARGQLDVDVAFWGGAVPENLEAIGELHASGVRGVKAFLTPSGIPEFGHLEAAGLRRALEAVAEVGSILLVHAESPEDESWRDGVPDGGARPELSAPRPLGRSYDAFLASRPGSSERRAIAAVLDAAWLTRARVHIVHLSDAGALPMLRRARAEGVAVTVETCAHYLALAAEDVPDGATQFKCCPPIRERANADVLWEGLLDGTIDAIVSDHSPAPADWKLRGDGDFGLAWGGVAGLQVAVAAAWGQARERGIPLARFLPWVTTGPAAIASLPAGAIVPGAAANLLAFDPDAETTVDAARLAHRHPVSAFDGARVAGRAVTVWLHGEQVVGGAVDGGTASRVIGGRGRDLTDELVAGPGTRSA